MEGCRSLEKARFDLCLTVMIILIESVRFFDVESQLSIENISSFSISNGNNVSLDQETISLFVEKWRNYFMDKDERFCSLFQKIKNHQLPEGFEIYFPFFFNKTSSFFDVFKNYKYFKINDLTDEINKFHELIEERYQDGYKAVSYTHLTLPTSNGV